MRIIYLFCLLILTKAVHAQTNSRQEFEARLDLLKKQNNLRDWIYERIAYSAEKPLERLPFLMSSVNQAWRKPANNTESEAWLNLLSNQGYYQLYTGNVLQSIEEYEKAYAFYSANPLKGFDLVEYILKPLGNNYTRLGDYSSALFIQKKSLEIAKKNKDSLSVASVYNNLAISYKSMGDLKEAEKICRHGFAYLSSVKTLSGLLNSTLADIYFEQGDIKKASSAVNSALTILSQNKRDPYSDYWRLSAYTLAGNIEQQKSNYSKARQFYQSGLNLIEQSFKGGRPREKANLLMQSGNIALNEKKPAIGIVYYNRALETLLPDFKSKGNQNLPPANSLYGENRLYDVLEGKARALLQLNKDQLALDNFLLALKAGKKSREAFSAESDKLYYQKQSKRVIGLALNTAYALWKKTGDRKYALTILHLSEQAKAQTLSDEVERNRELLSNRNNHLLKQYIKLNRALAFYEKESILNKNISVLSNKQEVQYKLALLEKEIRKRYPSWNQVAHSSDSLSETLTRSIPSSTYAINFFWGEEHLYVISLTKKGIDTITRINDAPALKQRITSYIESYFKHGPALMTNHPERFFSESHAIYSLLLSENINRAGQKNLLIINDDILGYLPFESLITSPGYSSNISSWPFLIRKKQVTYAYSLRTWLTLSPESAVPTKSFSGFFIAQSGKNVLLPAVEEEARNLKHLVKGRIYLENEATLKNFRGALNTASSLHLSTHSYSFGQRNEPVLELSDGKFFLCELSAQLKVPKLVVLSACSTADGILASGEGVLSLSRGFTAAGTSGVVAGLWNINDVSSAHIVSNFYSKLQKGKEVSLALHQAKLDYISQTHSNPSLLLPYYWSSLIYIGKPQVAPLQYNSDSDLVYWALTGSALAILAGLLAYRKSRIPRNNNS